MNGQPRLYEWHVELAAVCFAALHGVEVVVRNAVDSALGEGQPQAPLHETWLLDLDVLQPHGLRYVAAAAQRLGTRHPVTRDSIVAAVPFGFWATLLGRRYDALWQRRLHRAFAGAPGRRDVLHRLEAIHALRNRVAHHDSLLGQNVAGCFGDMLTVAGWVDHEAAGWLRRIADVEGVLARRP